MSARTPERAWIAEAIEKLAAAQERERSLEQAQLRAAEIEQAAQADIDATERAAEGLVKRIKEAALAGDHAPSSVPDDVRHQAIARSRLSAAQAALSEITGDLESARSASVEAARSLERATAGVLVVHARELIAEALEAERTVERIRYELWALDRVGGSPGPGGVHQPFAFPKEGIALVRDIAAMSPAALGSSGVDVNAPMERWKAYREALRADPDAEIVQA